MGEKIISEKLIKLSAAFVQTAHHPTIATVAHLLIRICNSYRNHAGTDSIKPKNDSPSAFKASAR